MKGTMMTKGAMWDWGFGRVRSRAGQDRSLSPTTVAARLRTVLASTEAENAAVRKAAGSVLRAIGIGAAAALRTLLLACGVVLLLPLSQAAAAPATKPSAAMEWKSCVTAECHANVKKQKVLHGPVNVDACDACHKVEDAKQHTFSLIRGKTETCTFCHKVDTGNKAVVHKPVTQGECLQCHDPHGGTSGKFLRGASMTEMCAKCHTDVLANKKTLHGPAAAGACGSCHQAHASDFPKLLAVQGRDLCLSCHTDMKNELKTAKFTHKAVEQDCMKCHDPHASNFPKVTKLAPVELCTSCHEHDKIKQAATVAKFKHTIVTANDACLNCHTAHGGSLAKLMKNDPIKVCMKCHAEPIKVDKAITVAGVAEVLDPKMIKHGPIREGNCGGCHNVHGSDVAKLLAKPYPETFYQGFSLDKYELCFTCHDKQLVLNEKARGLTGFRNGDVNLHFVHVNKPEKGRNCRACHSTHASSHELHVRDSVPYGNWQMPIKFAKMGDGGSCSPGCHKEYRYDRVNPADYSKLTIAPATSPSTTSSTTLPTTLPTKE